MNGENVARLQRHIGVAILLQHGLADFQIAAFYRNVAAAVDVIADQVGSVEQCIALESAGGAHQLRRGHAFKQRIGAGPQHFSLHGHRGRILLVAAEDANGVETAAAAGLHCRSARRER